MKLVWDDVRADISGANGPIVLTLRPSRLRSVIEMVSSGYLMLIFIPSCYAVVKFGMSGQLYEMTAKGKWLHFLAGYEVLALIVVVFLYLAMIISFGPGLWTGAKALMSRRKVRIEDGVVSVSELGLFGQPIEEWSAPLSEFTGVRLSSKWVGMRNKQLLELAHRQKERTITLHAADTIDRDLWNAYVRRLGRPAIDMSDGKTARIPKNITEPLAQALPAANAKREEMLWRAIPSMLKVEEGPARTVVTYRCKRPMDEMLKLTFLSAAVLMATLYAWLGLKSFFGVTHVAKSASLSAAELTDKFVNLLTNPWMLVIMLAPMALLYFQSRTKRKLVIEGDEIRLEQGLLRYLWPKAFLHRLAFGDVMAIKTVVPENMDGELPASLRDLPAETRERLMEGMQRLVIEGRHGRMELGRAIPADVSDWLRRLIETKMSANAGPQ